MSRPIGTDAVDRRSFLRRAAGAAGAAVAARYAGVPLLRAATPGAPAVRVTPDDIGLQLFTVRDRFQKDYPGTLLEVGRIGYKRVQTTLSYGRYSPKEIRSFLDAAGLSAPATHVSPPAGADFERTLEGYRLIGHRYTTVRVGGERARPAGPAGGGAAPTERQGGAAAGGAGNGGRAARPSAPPPQTLDEVKRTAEALNAAGRITQKHGIKVIVHNHTAEFAPLADSPLRPYDVLLSETDPSLVAMELDIGWATVAGENALELFRRAPGRFEVWHVKDVAGLSALRGLSSQAERQRAARIVPLGEGEIDYAAVFAAAEQAGMKYFFVEQDSAPESGDSIAEAAKSYRALARLLA